MQIQTFPLALLILLAGCEMLGSAEPAGRIELDVARAAVETGERNTVIARNEGSRPIFAPSCGGLAAFDIEVRECGTWTLYGGIHNPCQAIFAMTPIEVRSRAEIRTDFTIHEAGTYRVILRPKHAVPVSSRAFVVKASDRGGP